MERISKRALSLSEFSTSSSHGAWGSGLGFPEGGDGKNTIGIRFRGFTAFSPGREIKDWSLAMNLRASSSFIGSCKTKSLAIQRGTGSKLLWPAPAPEFSRRLASRCEGCDSPLAEAFFFIARLSIERKR